MIILLDMDNKMVNFELGSMKASWLNFMALITTQISPSNPFVASQWNHELHRVP